MKELEQLKTALKEFEKVVKEKRKEIVYVKNYTFDDVTDYNELCRISEKITQLETAITHISTTKIF